MEVYKKYIGMLNDDDVKIRLSSLKELSSLINKGKIKKPERADHYVNNHIHTIYSFSPYSPAKAIWMAYNYGLSTAGLMDHDSISGAEEFIKAGKILHIATTIGVECRVDFSKTPLKGKRLNNPDQKSIAYVALHGIPHNKLAVIKDHFSSYSKYRNQRNELMVKKINYMFKSDEMQLDFEKDVVPISKSDEGGSITERHILFALAQKMVALFGRGQALISFLGKDLDICISLQDQQKLTDVDNNFYVYDLLGILKRDLLEKFYVSATRECPDVGRIAKLAEETGAILAYAYLGDVEDSITGDKKSQKFEDDYLNLLFEVLKDYGFRAVTYMPSRNTSAQLLRVKDLCSKYGMFQISGEDINSPQQSFVCQALKDEAFSHLVDSTWALIGHERAATLDIESAMFSKSTMEKYPDLNDRIDVYRKLARELNI